MADTTALEKRKSTSARLSLRKQALLWSEYMPERAHHLILEAVGGGASQKTAAEAGGFTLAELRYVFKLAEDGHPAYRDFRDEYYKRHADCVMGVVEAQHRRAISDEGSISDRRFALELSEPETYKDPPRGSPTPSVKTAFQANECVFNVTTSWDDEADVVDAESVESGEVVDE